MGQKSTVRDDSWPAVCRSWRRGGKPSLALRFLRRGRCPVTALAAAFASALAALAAPRTAARRIRRRLRRRVARDDFHLGAFAQAVGAVDDDQRARRNAGVDRSDLALRRADADRRYGHCLVILDH